MPREQEADEAIAAKFGCAPEEISAARQRLAQDTLMRKLIDHDLGAKIEALRNTLETVKPEDLRDVQGQIKGTRAARGVVLQTQP
jgi:hypothetical protein